MTNPDPDRIADAALTAAATDSEVVEAAVLVEDVSIDGMCGVY